MIAGAAGSTGAMLPETLQYSGMARTARPFVTVSGVAAMRSAVAMVAPDVGRPIADAGIDAWARVSQPVAFFANGNCGEPAWPASVAAAMAMTIVALVTVRVIGELAFG